MAVSVGDLTIKRGVHRIHPYVADLLTFHASTYVQFLYFRQEAIPSDATITFAAKACGFDIRFPIAPFVTSAISNHVPVEIRLQVISKGPDPGGINIAGVKSVAANLTSALFALFAETASDWVRTNISTAFDKWPSTINFGRIVRNAVVHGGTVNIKSPTAVGGSWRGLSYSNAQDGRKIINVDLSYGDLLILMVETEEELTQLGAPFDLG